MSGSGRSPVPRRSRLPGLILGLLVIIICLATLLLVLLAYLLLAGNGPRQEASGPGTTPQEATPSAGVPAEVGERPLQMTSTTPLSTVPVAASATETAVPLPATLPAATLTPEATPLPPALAAALAWQPSPPPSDAELEAMVASMSLEDRVAQMLMVGFGGRSLARSPELPVMVGQHHVGGIVLVEANAHDPQQLQALTAEVQALATSAGQGIPLFVAINHEGGTVVRITEGATGFPGNMAVAATGRPDYAYLSAALAARELRAMGVNMNLAPVLDVNDNPMNPVIGTRSFGSSAEMVAHYGRLAVQGTQAAGVVAVAKHFPGHGGVAADSHGTLPVVTASREALWAHELLPFAAAIEEGVEVIMTAHLAVPALDASGRPATLSPQILTGLLREEMGFGGLIMTDSLGMSGVRAGRGQVQAALEAVQAGADILLSTTPMQDHVAILEALAGAVRGGQIPAARIDASVVRILRVKYAYGLFGVQPAAGLHVVGSAEHQAVADEIARQAVTVLRLDPSALPLPPPPAQLLVVSPALLPPARAGEGTAFGQALRQRGYGVTELVYDVGSGASQEQVRAAALAQAAGHDAAIFGEWGLVTHYVNGGETWQEELVAALGRRSPHLVVVAWHNPAALLRCGPVPAFLTAYGDTLSQVAAVAAVLAGEQAASGQMPMELAGE